MHPVSDATIALLRRTTNAPSLRWRLYVVGPVGERRDYTDRLDIDSLQAVNWEIERSYAKLTPGDARFSVLDNGEVEGFVQQANPAFVELWAAATGVGPLDWACVFCGWLSPNDVQRVVRQSGEQVLDCYARSFLSGLSGQPASLFAGLPPLPSLMTLHEFAGRLVFKMNPVLLPMGLELQPDVLCRAIDTPDGSYIKSTWRESALTGGPINYGPAVCVSETDGDWLILYYDMPTGQLWRRWIDKDGRIVRRQEYVRYCGMCRDARFVLAGGRVLLVLSAAWSWWPGFGYKVRTIVVLDRAGEFLGEWNADDCRPVRGGETYHPIGAIVYDPLSDEVVFTCNRLANLPPSGLKNLRARIAVDDLLSGGTPTADWPDNGHALSAGGFFAGEVNGFTGRWVTAAVLQMDAWPWTIRHNTYRRAMSSGYEYLCTYKVELFRDSAVGWQVSAGLFVFTPGDTAFRFCLPNPVRSPVSTDGAAIMANCVPDPDCALTAWHQAWVACPVGNNDYRLRFYRYHPPSAMLTVTEFSPTIRQERPNGLNEVPLFCLLRQAPTYSFLGWAQDYTGNEEHLTVLVDTAFPPVLRVAGLNLADGTLRELLEQVAEATGHYLVFSRRTASGKVRFVVRPRLDAPPFYTLAGGDVVADSVRLQANEPLFVVVSSQGVTSQYPQFVVPAALKLVSVSNDAIPTSVVPAMAKFLYQLFTGADQTVKTETDGVLWAEIADPVEFSVGDALVQGIITRLEVDANGRGQLTIVGRDARVNRRLPRQVTED